MQRLFSMFPGGAPGVALVVLRISVASGIWIEKWIADDVLPGAIDVGLRSLLALALLSGFGSPVAAAIALALSLFVAATQPPQCTPVALLTACNAVVLVLLGPGAYSIDARLFGRRVIVLPDKHGQPPDRSD